MSFDIIEAGINLFLAKLRYGSLEKKSGSAPLSNACYFQIQRVIGVSDIESTALAPDSPPYVIIFNIYIKY